MRVPQFMGLERFSHVMHLTSIVEGRLADDRDRLDALRRVLSGRHRLGRAQGPRHADHPRSSSRLAAACTPARSGYLDFAGNLDFCIAIRTIIMAGRHAYVQAGAGIVIDSNPTAEYEETRDKARALLRALELAQEGL